MEAAREAASNSGPRKLLAPIQLLAYPRKQARAQNANQLGPANLPSFSGNGGRSHLLAAGRRLSRERAKRRSCSVCSAELPLLARLKLQRLTAERLLGAAKPSAFIGRRWFRVDWRFGGGGGGGQVRGLLVGAKCVRECSWWRKH